MSEVKMNEGKSPDQAGTATASEAADGVSVVTTTSTAANGWLGRLVQSTKRLFNRSMQSAGASLKDAWNAMKEPVAEQDVDQRQTLQQCQKDLRECREKLIQHQRNVAPWYPRFLLSIAVLVATASPIFVVLRDIYQKSHVTQNLSNSHLVLLSACVVGWLGAVAAAFWYTRTRR